MTGLHYFVRIVLDQPAPEPFEAHEIVVGIGKRSITARYFFRASDAAERASKHEEALREMWPALGLVFPRVLREAQAKGWAPCRA